MSKKDYKRLIGELISKSDDAEYIKAVFSFATAYPDRTVRVPNAHGDIVASVSRLSVTG